MRVITVHNKYFIIFNGDLQVQSARRSSEDTELQLTIQTRKNISTGIGFLRSPKLLSLSALSPLSTLAPLELQALLRSLPPLVLHEHLDVVLPLLATPLPPYRPAYTEG
jgi:hypothetical protein